jgi:hypothetical protein
MVAFQSLINSSAPLGAGYHHIDIVAPATGTDERFRQSGTVVAGPYRRAISAGSALVPPSAARSDAVAGST